MVTTTSTGDRRPHRRPSHPQAVPCHLHPRPARGRCNRRPLGGCVALIGFGANAIGNVNDEIRASTNAFVASWNAGDPTSQLEASCFDGEFPPIDWLIPDATELLWEEDGIAFVERSGNGYLASNADGETSAIPGFEDHDNAWIDVTFTDTGGAGFTTAQLTFVDTQSDDRWELCGISKE